VAVRTPPAAVTESRRNAASGGTGDTGEVKRATAASVKKTGTLTAAAMRPLRPTVFSPCCMYGITGLEIFLIGAGTTFRIGLVLVTTCGEQAR
jgi:hypothetical protein